MQRKENFLPFFIVFFGLSLFIIILGKSGIINGLTSLINKTTFPARTATLNIFGFQNSAIKKLSEENAALRKKILDKQSLILENKALKDQFAISSSKSQSLLPSRVIGSPGFIPGVSLPNYLIIDKGSNDNVIQGDTIVIENYLVGKVITSANDFSKVELVNAKNSTFTGKIVPQDGAEISGIIRGQGAREIIFDNVLLTAAIKKGDLVLTKGETGESGKGFPPDLIVGKIVSVEKKSADLFQKAEVVSFIDFTNLTTVFILK